MEKEKERLLGEMDRRTRLWEGMRDDAKSRLKTGMGKAIAKIEFEVAIDALKRIEERKREIVGVTAHKLLSEQPTKSFKAVPEKVKRALTVAKTSATEEDLKEPIKNVIR